MAASSVAIVIMGVVGCVAGILCLLPACGLAYGIKEGRAQAQGHGARAARSARGERERRKAVETTRVEAWKEAAPKAVPAQNTLQGLRGGRAVHALRRALTRSQRTQQRLDLQNLGFGTYLPSGASGARAAHAQPEAEPEVSGEDAEAWAWTLRNAGRAREARAWPEPHTEPRRGRTMRPIGGPMAGCELEMDLSLLDA